MHSLQESLTYKGKRLSPSTICSCYTTVALKWLYFLGQMSAVCVGLVGFGVVKHHNTALPLIALTESFCLTFTVTENSGKGFTEQNSVWKWDWGTERESERNITRPLPVFTFAILSNLSKLLSWPLRKKKHMLNVKKQRNMTDHLHFVHFAPWHKTLNCVFFPRRQTTRPAFN